MNSSDHIPPEGGELSFSGTAAGEAGQTEEILEETEEEALDDSVTEAGVIIPGPQKQNDKPEEAERKYDFAADLFEWSHALLSAVVIIVLLFAICLSMFSVQQVSMTNTLQEGDMLLISNLFYTPKQGDIIMFTHMGLSLTHDVENDRYSPLVKRVVAVAGDRIYYDQELRKLVVNGVPLDEPYLRSQDFGPRGVLLNEEVTVPEGYLFACGDNRAESYDSREIGFIDERMVLGRVLLRLFPINRMGTV